MTYTLRQIINACCGNRDAQLFNRGLNPHHIRKYMYDHAYIQQDLKDFYPNITLHYSVPGPKYRPQNFPIDLYREKIIHQVPNSSYKIFLISDTSKSPDSYVERGWHIEYFEKNLIPIKQKFGIIYSHSDRLECKIMSIKSYVDLNEGTAKIEDPYLSKHQISFSDMLEKYLGLLLDLEPIFGYDMIRRSI